MSANYLIRDSLLNVSPKAGFSLFSGLGNKPPTKKNGHMTAKSHYLQAPFWCVGSNSIMSLAANLRAEKNKNLDKDFFDLFVFDFPVRESSTKCQNVASNSDSAVPVPCLKATNTKNRSHYLLGSGAFMTDSLFIGDIVFTP